MQENVDAKLLAQLAKKLEPEHREKILDLYRPTPNLQKIIRQLSSELPNINQPTKKGAGAQERDI